MKKTTLEDQDKQLHYNLGHRLWIYQKERFPLIAHGPLVLVFSFCAVAFSARLRIDDWPTWQSMSVAFISSLIFFLQLRIADEFKDADEDLRWRPYRAVPRGLVKLKELAVVFVVGAIIQLGLVLLWNMYLLPILIFAWLYLAAMSFEFGARDWLKTRPITYLWTHMLIMPIIDFYATASDWATSGALPPAGLLFFLITSFCNGIVIEIGRKIRTVDQEEDGVETYSKLWGPGRASAIWWCFIAVTAFFAGCAAYEVGALIPVVFVLCTLMLAFGILTISFCRNLNHKLVTMFELSSALWTFFLYLSLGVLPGVFIHV